MKIVIMSNNTSQELVDNNRRIGRVEWYNPKRGFGFITTLIGEEVGPRR